MAAREVAKHREIYKRIQQAILTGEYAVGQRIPTEAELGASYRVSRPTVSRALRELEQEGFLTRKRGAGTFVRDPQHSSSGLFGFTIPHSEGGIMASTTAQIVHQAELNGYGVLFGGAAARHASFSPQHVEAFCEQFITRKVAGVFFLPLIIPENQIEINRQITDRLTQAGIPVVLLDRDIYDYPRRSPYDLVGVDNRRNGFVLTQHLIHLGCRRIAFVTLDLPVSTSTARIAGYRDALMDANIDPDPSLVFHWGRAQDIDAVRNMVQTSKAEAFVCINDDTARTLMHHVAILGARVPNDVRIVGFDDLPFAASLPVPLTTMHQPTREMGAVAVETMLSRLTNPQRPARDVTLRCDLRVRASCGAHLSDGHTGFPADRDTIIAQANSREMVG